MHSWRLTNGPLSLLPRLIVESAHWLVLPIAALLFFPSAWTGVGFIGAALLFLCRWLVVGTPVPISRANWVVLLLLALTAIGYAISLAPDLAIITAAQLTASVTVFYVMLDRIKTPADLWSGAVVLVVLGILFSLAAPLTVKWDPGKVFRLEGFYNQVWPRLSKVTNPNILAGGIAPIVPLALALVFQTTRRWRVIGALALAPMIGILILLQSRGALFALAAGLGVWLVLQQRWALPLLPIGAAGALAANAAIGGMSPAQFVYGSLGSSGNGTFIQRQDLWVQGLYLLRQNPLFGIGLNAFPRIGPISPPNSPQAPGYSYNHVHNLFIQVGLDTGIFGLAAFVALIGMAAVLAWRAYRNGREGQLGIGVLGALTVIVVHGFGDVAVWGTAKSSIVLWLVLGLAFGMERVWNAGKPQV